MWQMLLVSTPNPLSKTPGSPAGVISGFPHTEISPPFLTLPVPLPEGFPHTLEACAPAQGREVWASYPLGIQSVPT